MSEPECPVFAAQVASNGAIQSDRRSCRQTAAKLVEIGSGKPSAGVDEPVAEPNNQYDFGSPSTRSAMWLKISCGLTGAMRAIWISRK